MELLEIAAYSRETLEELENAVRKITDNTPTAYKIVLSKPEKKSQEIQKVNILLKENFYQAEKYTKTQVFHENIKADEIAIRIVELLAASFSQLNAWSTDAEFQIMVSKKGKVSFKKKLLKASEARPEERREHNRKKNYLLKEGEVIEPLVDMGIFTKEGRVVASMQDKYRQINRFVEIVDDEIRKIPKDHFKIVDFGCGKSYLTFILYYYFTKIKGVDVEMVGLDLKEDVIRHCNEAAAKYGYSGLHFECGDVSMYKSDTPADMVITLHACDTATDYALFHAVNWKAGMIFSVPCCQHEVNKQFKTDDLALLGRYGIIKERTSALITDAIRANLLEYHGYQTQVMEFVSLDNTPKNLLIRAVRRDYAAEIGKEEKAEEKKGKMLAARSEASRKRYLKEVEALMEEFHLNPTLYRLFKEQEEKKME